MQQPKKYPRACENCQREFYVEKRRKDSARFCSRACHGAFTCLDSLSSRLEAASMPVTECGCHIWLLSTHRAGHGQLTYRCQHMFAHRAAWEAYRGPIPDGMHVLHRCNVPQCINPDHLYLGKDLQNARDRVAAGTQAIPPRNIGSDHPNAVINDDIAREIRYSRRHGVELADKFGVSTATVSAIRTGRLWKHVA